MIDYHETERKQWIDSIGKPNGNIRRSVILLLAGIGLGVVVGDVINFAIWLFS